MPISREWYAISEFRFHEFVALDCAYRLASENLGSHLKIICQRTVIFYNI